ncbi:YkvA family protein [Phytohabitans sp. LJ34]|uniref:YkvA family protein n=1 Tax=Phytohabitans sp. LJ34 TaxID=3452217 RepID=UPI003F8AA58C
MGRTLNRTAAFTALGRALTARARGGPSVGARLAALPRMVWATITGRYDGGVRLAMMVAATAYVASPIDLVPEAFLLLVGLIDDAVVIAWLAGAILAETERFIEWDAARRSVIHGHVV